MNKSASGSFNSHIFLIGFMGAGKSTVAQALAGLLQRPVVEMDESLVQIHQKSIPEIFAAYGEPYFRQQETQLIASLQNETPKLISCGGGVVMRQENLTLMKQMGTTVLLSASPATILERVKEDTNRPLLHNRKSIEGISELLEARLPHYQKAADLVVSVDNRTPQEIAAEIASLLERKEF